MKLHLPLSLRTSLLALVCLLTAGAAHADSLAGSLGANWGNTLYVGDSITHGFNYYSYRWELFKTQVDNGLAQNEIGIQTGYVSNASTNITYGNGTFANLHAAQTGITAAQVAGNGSGKLDGSGIVQWLGQDSGYTGSYSVHDTSGTAATPDTAFIMLGTNDIFSGKMSESNVSTMTGTLLGYLESVVGAIRTANQEATIIVNAMPTWSEARTGNMSGATNWAALTTYNESLKEWAAENGVTFIDINKGLTNVANTAKPGAGVATLFKDSSHSSETQHPNAQGDLIIAGNIARQLGYAGRTAGQLRVDAADTDVFTHQAADILNAATAAGGVSLSGNALELAEGSSLSMAWSTEDDLSTGFTVDFSFAQGLGDGYGDGTWNTTSHFSLSIGDGTNAGTLNVNEACIQWGSTILYSLDTSALTDSLRVAYVYGNAAQNLSSGFYVWMGDMLIGEALSSSGDTINGLSLTNGSGTTTTLGHLSLASGAWAPTTTGLTNGNPLIPASSGNALETVEKALAAISLGNTTTAIRNQSGISSGNHAVISVEGGTLAANWLVASNSDFTGNVDVTLGGTVTKNMAGQYNVVQYQGTLNGNISFTLAEDFETTGSNPTWGAFIGTESATVNGNLAMVFSSDQLTVSKDVYSKRSYALAGVNSSTVSGSVSISVNAGNFIGNVYGGAVSNNTIGGNTSVTLNGGTITGDVYGGGSNGTINGGSTVTVTGGASVSGNISAGGSGGTINGGTLLTLKDVQEGDAFADYTGTLSGNAGATVDGTRELRLENVQLPSLKATLQNFDKVSITGQSDMGLSDLGGASLLDVNDNSRLTLTGGEHSVRIQNNATVVVASGATLHLDGTNMDGNVSGRYELQGGTMSVTAYDHLSAHIAVSSGSLSNNGTVLDGMVSVAATGQVSLEGVALEHISSISVAEGGQVDLVLSSASLEGVSSLTRSGDEALALRLETLSLDLSSSNNAQGDVCLLLGEGGSLTTETIHLHLDSALSSQLTTVGEGRLWVNQGSLAAGQVHLHLAEGNGQQVALQGIGSENGYSYVSYWAHTASTLTSSSDHTVSFGNNGNTIAAQDGVASGNVAITVQGGSMSADYLVVNQGNYSGDIQVVLSGEVVKSTAEKYNVVHYSGTLNGDISFALADDFTTSGNHAAWDSFIGADSGTVTGNLKMEFSSSDFTLTDSSSNRDCALAGVFNGKVNGAVSVTINAGEFNGHIYGGAIGKAADAIGKGTLVSLNGGSVSGNVYGGGSTGVINEDSAVTVTGAAAVSGNICAGGSGGSIMGDTLLTVKDVQEGDAFASYSGTLSGNAGATVAGTRTLCFDDVQLSAFAASLEQFDAVRVSGESNVALSSLGGASSLSVEEGSRLTLSGTNLNLADAFLTLGVDSQLADSPVLNLVEGSLAIDSLTLNLSAELCSYLVSAPAMMALADAASVPSGTAFLSGQLTLALGQVSAQSVSINMAEGYENYSISAVIEMDSTSGSSVITYSLTQQSVPEPTTATLSLLALAALAARRRRVLG